MNKTRNLKLASIAVILLLSLTLSTVAYAPPIQPMTVVGVVYFDTDPAGAGVTVYAKEDTTIIDQCLTLATGQYYLQLEGPAEDTLIDLYVEEELVDTLPLNYATYLSDYDLIVTGDAPPANEVPVADAGGLYSGEEGVAIDFDGSGSSDSDGTIESYAWVFGDGGTAAVESPSYTYTAAGEYTVTLTVTDDEGATDDDETTATITEAGAPPANEVPVADAGGPYDGFVGSPISFDGSDSTDDGTIESWAWVFGDGETGTGETTSHTYDDADTYTVTLTVTDDEGATDIDTTDATVILVVSGEGFSIDFVTPGDVVYGDTLIVRGSGITSGNMVKVYWDFATAVNELNTTEGLPSGDFECEIDVPSAYYGNHYIWAIDTASGLPARSDAIFVVSRVKLTPSSGLEGDDIVVKGYGFGEEVDVNVTFGGLAEGIGEDETDEMGYFEYTFEVEVEVDGDYTVTALDADDNYAEAEFTVGAALTLDKDVGPAGTIVKVSFRGFMPSTEINTEVDITLDGEPVSTKDGKNVTASKTGTGTVYIVIPSVEEGEYDWRNADH